MRFASAVVIGLACTFAPSVSASQTPPTSYPALSNRQPYPEPPLPPLPAAGGRFSDPTFATLLLRVTDSATRPGEIGRSFSTPSAAHQLAWNATSDRFYVRSLTGWYFPYSFDATTLTALRIGSLLIQSHIEPQFSYRLRDILYAGWTRVVSGHDYPLIHSYDFSSGVYTELMDLRQLVTNTLDLADTYV